MLIDVCSLMEVHLYMSTLDRRNGRNPNLGFGMVPTSPTNRESDLSAARLVRESLSGDKNQADLMDAISRVKGLCNRSWRQDQPDWTLVWLELGLPDPRRLRWMGKDLDSYRKAIKEDRVADALIISERLERAGLVTCLTYFLGEDEPVVIDGMGFLYLLSSRDDRTLLKIGQTKRDVPTRVREINTATGVVSPFGARHIWRVKNAERAERGIHEALRENRIRSDREFFRLSYSECVQFIEAFLEAHGEKVRSQGLISGMKMEKGYGFLECDGLRYFFHRSEVRAPSFECLRVGDKVEFDRLDTTYGLAAAEVRFIE